MGSIGVAQGRRSPSCFGDVLLDFGHEEVQAREHPKVLDDVEDSCKDLSVLGAQPRQEGAHSLWCKPGCPPVLDWKKMEAEEGEISVNRQAENAPELNTTEHNSHWSVPSAPEVLTSARWIS